MLSMNRESAYLLWNIWHSGWSLKHGRSGYYFPTACMQLSFLSNTFLAHPCFPTLLMVLPRITRRGDWHVTALSQNLNFIGCIWTRDLSIVSCIKSLQRTVTTFCLFIYLFIYTRRMVLPPPPNVSFEYSVMSCCLTSALMQGMPEFWLLTCRSMLVFNERDQLNSFYQADWKLMDISKDISFHVGFLPLPYPASFHPCICRHTAVLWCSNMHEGKRNNFM